MQVRFSDSISFHPSVRPLERRSPLLTTKLLTLCLVSGFAVTGSAAGQGYNHETSLNRTSIFLDGSASNTQFPSYADNALGVEVGATYQRSLLLGAQVKFASHSISANFDQTQLMAGYRVGMRSTEGDLNTKDSRLHLDRLSPYAVFGGGLAFVQVPVIYGSNKPGPTDKAPCWQVSVGVDRGYRHLSWRVLEFSFTKLYPDAFNLRTFSATTGVVYHFHH